MSMSAISRSHLSSGNSLTGATCWTPALGTTTSSRPNASSAASTAARLPSRVVRSAAKPVPGSPSASRSTDSTSSPSPISRSATARPMPLAAPVTSAARASSAALRQPREPGVPLRADVVHPAHRVGERRGRERVAQLAALAAGARPARRGRARRGAWSPPGGSSAARRPAATPSGPAAARASARPGGGSGRPGRRTPRRFCHLRRAHAARGERLQRGPQTAPSSANRCSVTTKRVPPGWSSSTPLDDRARPR